MDPQFQESFVNRKHRVLGRGLFPFSLRHLFALSVFESPFLFQHKQIEWADLERAVAVCSMRNPVAELQQIHRQRGIWGQLVRHFSPNQLIPESAKFVAYKDDYHSLPLTYDSEGKSAKAPAILRLVEFLKNHGFDEREFSPFYPIPNPLNVWDIPTGQAFWRYYTICELSGAEINIFDDEDRELLELAETLPDPQEGAS